MAHEIFISFATKDTRVAMTLCSALEARGLSCWISARDIEPGENFQVAIVRALRRARVMLLVFTANSNASEEMTKELALASQQKLMVIPCRVEDVTPSDAFAYEFATRQWIDVFSDWEKAIEQLARRIQHAIGGETRTPAAAAPAVSEQRTAATPAKSSSKSPTPVAEEATPIRAEPRSIAAPAAEPAASATPSKRAAAAVAAGEIHAMEADAPLETVAASAGGGRRLAFAIAAAAVIGVIGAVAMTSVFGRGGQTDAPARVAASPTPRVAAALSVAEPAADAGAGAAAVAPQEPALEEAPKLTKTAAKPKTKRAVTKVASETVDIPY